MRISKFEYYHGAVLIKLIRKDPVTLTLVECKPKQNRALYVINDDIAITIVSSASPRIVKQKPEGISWTFQVRQPSNTNTKYRNFYALVGAPRNIGDSDAIICLLDPDNIRALNLIEQPHSITVRKPSKKGQLMVFHNKEIIFRVPQGAIDSLPIHR